MDRNLLQATVTLAISDGQPIPRKTFIEFAKANLTDVAYRSPRDSDRGDFLRHRHGKV